ncbi:hypothetical protein BaRGS_00003741, partial [Batillaria attramentaria]
MHDSGTVSIPNKIKRLKIMLMKCAERKSSIGLKAGKTADDEEAEHFTKLINSDCASEVGRQSSRETKKLRSNKVTALPLAADLLAQSLFEERYVSSEFKNFMQQNSRKFLLRYLSLSIHHRGAPINGSQWRVCNLSPEEARMFPRQSDASSYGVHICAVSEQRRAVEYQGHALLKVLARNVWSGFHQWRERRSQAGFAPAACPMIRTRRVPCRRLDPFRNRGPCIDKAEEAGLKVKLVVADQGSNNRKMFDK